MSGYKLVAIDMDDTLLDQKLKIAGPARAAIYKAREMGVRVTLSTGRMYCSALPFARDLKINVPLITYQGALVVNSFSGEILQHYPVPLECARDIISRIKPLGYHINLYINDTLYVHKKTPESEHYENISGIEAREVGDLLKFLKDAPTKVLIISGEPQLDQLIEKFRPIYGEKLHITKSKPFYLEFSHSRATKGHALKNLASKYEIEPEEVMAIGDSYNDLEMLDYAGLGVVVGNARPEIKTHANYVTTGHYGEGVAEAIERFVINKGKR